MPFSNGAWIFPVSLIFPKGYGCGAITGRVKPRFFGLSRNSAARYVNAIHGDIYGFRIVNVPELCGIYEDKGRKDIDKYITERRQAFDELGAEETLTGHFGTPLNVMQYILMGRYDRRFGDFTHVTTNLTLEDVKARYEDRIYDRCKEMFNIVYLGGKTYREKPYGWTNN